VTFTPPSKSSILSWTSSKNPSAKTERTSSESWAGLKGGPDAGLHAAEDDRLLHAAVALHGELLDQDGRRGLGADGLGQRHQDRQHDDGGKTQAPP
jgi:hypothetical protein